MPRRVEDGEKWGELIQFITSCGQGVVSCVMKRLMRDSPAGCAASLPKSQSRSQYQRLFPGRRLSPNLRRSLSLRLNLSRRLNPSLPLNPSLHQSLSRRLSPSLRQNHCLSPGPGPGLGPGHCR